MKKIIYVLLTVLTVLAVIGCTNINDPANVAKRGITITGIKVVPMDKTALDPFLALPSGTEVLAGGLGINAWGGWDKNTALSGVVVDKEARFVTFGKDVKAETYQDYYGSIEFCGATTTNGACDWTTRIVPDGKNVKLDNPKDGKDYYILVTLDSDSSNEAKAELVEGKLEDFLYVTTIELKGLEDPVGLIGWNNDWNADVAGTVNGDVQTFTVNSYYLSSFKFRTPGTWDGDHNIGAATDSGNIEAAGAGKCKLVCTYDATKKQVTSVEVVPVN
ncbi:MAG: hypothetical protein IJD23_08480 [Spirochaetaceae bacterium]|nr:hypothetical protein [Spirochaetaceae bacterium]